MAQPKWVWIAGGLAVLFVIGVVNGDDQGSGGATPPGGRAADTCTVPQVVGMVHQEAQDALQAAGLFRLLEEDATGQGRMVLVDRNWVTTAQSVPGGQVVDCGTDITLAAKKIGE
ncbi:hypothetical protein [Saccharothrix sp. Mg75]|uniref:hypothetical protein n=1 Tax=Saccharothrix sp. Mg75 TaxID=3445357 RepID=UPI003EEE5149